MTDIYSEFYSLLIGLFGSTAFSSSFCTILSCFAVLFVVLIPFIIVFNILKKFGGG